MLIHVIPNVLQEFHKILIILFVEVWMKIQVMEVTAQFDRLDLTYLIEIW